MANTLILQDPSNNDAWKFSVDANGSLSLSGIIDGAWVEHWSVEHVVYMGTQKSFWTKIKNLCVNWKSGIPSQKGLSIGCAPKAEIGDSGEDYLKLFSDDPTEQYMQMNIGMHTDPTTGNRYFFAEGIEQGVAFRPIKIQPGSQAPIHPSLVNGWQDYGAPCTTANYFKDSFGRVHIGGRVKGGSGVIFTLPDGFRPPAEVKFSCTENNGFSSLKITPDGNVQQVTGGNTELSLDGVCFSTLAAV